MKIKYMIVCLAAVVIAAAGQATAQEKIVIDGEELIRSMTDAEMGVWYKKVYVESRQQKPQSIFSVGVHVGMDIGGAVPWPPANLRSDQMKMSAVPKLNPSLGLSFRANLPKRFSLTAEVTYKQVGIDAEAWVSGQQFRVPNPDGEELLTRFRGTAAVKMGFSMLEIPIYIGYSFRQGRDRLYLGAYYSYVFKGDFDTTPLKGLVENPNNPSEPPVMITPDSPVPSDMMPVFNDYLGRWDAGMLIGYEWQVIPRLTMTARVSMGFKDIFRSGSNYLEYKMLHMRGTVGISYAFLNFGGKRSNN